MNEHLKNRTSTLTGVVTLLVIVGIISVSIYLIVFDTQTASINDGEVLSESDQEEMVIDTEENIEAQDSNSQPTTDIEADTRRKPLLKVSLPSQNFSQRKIQNTILVWNLCALLIQKLLHTKLYYLKDLNQKNLLIYR